ncbi:MAG TPA: glycosyltransferase [Chthoniobacterales bacterium]
MPIRVAVDLTPLLPESAGQTIRPIIAGFLRGLVQQPRFELTLITNAATDREAARWFDRPVTTFCLDHPGHRRGRLPFRFFQRQQFRALYAPFGSARFLHSGVPVVSMVTNVFPNHGPWPSSEAARRQSELDNVRTSIVAARFQVLSDFTGAQFRGRHGIPAEKVFRTYPPVCPGPLPRPNPDADPETPYFLCPADSQPYRNHDVLLMAYQVYRLHSAQTAWRLVLTGMEPRRQDYLRNLAHTLGIADGIQFLRPANAEKADEMLRGSAGLVFPSLDETCGSQLAAAMQSGVPILTAETGGPAEMVGEAALKIDVRKPLALAEALGALAGSPTLREDLRLAGRRRHAALSLAKDVSRLSQTIAELADQPPVGPLRPGQVWRLWRARQDAMTRTVARRAYRLLRDHL